MDEFTRSNVYMAASNLRYDIQNCEDGSVVQHSTSILITRLGGNPNVVDQRNMPAVMLYLMALFIEKSTQP